MPRSAARLPGRQRIRRALAEDRFVLHAQPIYGIADGPGQLGASCCCGCGTSGELVMPGRFLYIAERFGLIPPIDRWVAGEAVELLAPS